MKILNETLEAQVSSAQIFSSLSWILGAEGAGSLPGSAQAIPATDYHQEDIVN